jgi:hypothetical protein
MRYLIIKASIKFVFKNLIVKVLIIVLFFENNVDNGFRNFSSTIYSRFSSSFPQTPAAHRLTIAGLGDIFRKITVSTLKGPNSEMTVF